MSETKVSENEEMGLLGWGIGLPTMEERWDFAQIL